ncbi:MAG: Dihydroorotate dehydrogenase B (NAD(+)), electron transfer subunit [candidate division TA06 bacterium ADurb.Bin417]|uniref:Dihydroorotate dehydrogenase B (NAD(+)), electron transfer subunit n=1 Tax=candidate division TA06 bacterium ADurb.Bin417 TaxID=1852828 RepID=A0A1V5MF59_UNCT6|nr:MAG: Dihydroorotate dehydrogenase B (NAD(+)), electron transfer subunit [candidate division TA06 bacterium ADurb.Bin417]
MFEILEKYYLGPKIQYALVKAPLIARKAEAGQFVILRVNEKGKRFPLTIADFDRDGGTITLVFQEMGKSTHLLGQLSAGDHIMNVLGPQGNPTEVEKFGRVVVVGGGIGVAPVFPLARKLKEHGNEVTAIIGFRSKEHVFWEERMRSAADRLLIATNDGSYGEKGFVTEVLARRLESGPADRIFAISPAVMMKAVADLTRPLGIKTIVSLNSMMVCGMGMCGACRATVDGKTRFTCLDGPDFDGHQVDFDELISRLGTYREEENVSFERWRKEAKHGN